jgi:transcriptional regulator with XRE-family HTH domain
MDYGLIKKIAKDKKISIKMLAELCNMTEAGLYQAMNNKTLKIEKLEEIANILAVPIIIFFEKNSNTAEPGQVNEMELPSPVEPLNTIDIMELKVPNKEKISLMRERISTLTLKLEITEHILLETSRQNEILKRQIKKLIQRS